MKTIGLATLTEIYNYGTKLQAYAMQEIFMSRGYDTEIIRFADRQNLISTLKYRIKDVLRSVAPRWMQHRQESIYLSKQYENLPNGSLVSVLKSRLKALNAMDSKYKIKTYVTRSEMIDGSRKYSAVVCGSDQIWKPSAKRLKIWTLQYIHKDVRRFSYAPSIGYGSIPEDKVSFYRKVIKEFYAVSVREVSAANILSSLSDKKISVVLDPTLLVGRNVWDKVLKEKAGLTNRSYCLCYLLGTTPEHRKMCSEFAKRQSLELYNFTHFKKYNDADEQLEGEHLYDVDPAEFVGLVSKAKFIVTDSFHCSCFAMMYHIPFATLLRYQSSDSESTNSRIFSLLGQFGMEGRICQSMDDIDKIIASSIDYPVVDRILESKRTESNAFVDNALKGLK